jgi:tetratricopeptide (TPR) repeat protein
MLIIPTYKVDTQRLLPQDLSMRRSLLLPVTVLVALGWASTNLGAQSAPPAENESSSTSQPPPVLDKSAEDGPGYYPQGAVKCVEIGRFYMRRGNYRGALSRFEEARDTDPNYAPAYLGLGKVYEKLGLKQKSLDAYRKYLDELPSDKDAMEARGAHRAIARLEKELRNPHSSSRASRN